jgi:hypothetical protein
MKQSSDVLGSTDAKSVALKLQRMGRGNDTILAHITPREAAMLKARGGSGTRNPQTGLLEFEDSYDFGGYDVGGYDPGAGDAGFYDYYGNYDYSPPVTGDYGDYGSFGDYTPSYEGGFTAADLPAVGAVETQFAGGGGARDPGFYPPDQAVVPTEEEVPTPEEEDRSELYKRIIDTGIRVPPQEKSFLSTLFGQGGVGRLGLGLGGALLSASQAQRAGRQAGAVSDQIRAAYERAAGDTRALAAPLTTAGAAALGQAQQGVLDPARLQQFEVARAQLAQQAARTGGVGAIQSAEAANRARLAALQAQQTAALQLLGPGNTLMSQAINQQLQGTTSALGTRLQLEGQANQAMANLYGQLARFIGG